MLNLFFVSLSTSFIVILINQLLFYLNFTRYTFSLMKIVENSFINYFILFASLSLLLFLFAIILFKMKIKISKSSYLFILSVAIFLIINLILRIYNKINLDLQSTLSLLFIVILSTYQYFYSIFYINSVK